MEPLNYSYDPGTDVMTIEGIRYSGDVFRGLGFKQAIPIGSRIFIEDRHDGVVVLRSEKEPA